MRPRPVLSKRAESRLAFWGEANPCQSFGEGLSARNLDLLKHIFSHAAASGKQCMAIGDFIEKNGAKGVTCHRSPTAHAKGAAFILAPLSTLGIKVRFSG